MTTTEKATRGHSLETCLEQQPYQTGQCTTSASSYTLFRWVNPRVVHSEDWKDL